MYLFAILYFFLSISNSAAHPCSCMLFGGMFPAVLGVTCSGCDRLIFDTARDCYTVALGRGTFDCAGAPGKAVAYVGGADIFFSLPVLR